MSVNSSSNIIIEKRENVQSPENIINELKKRNRLLENERKLRKIVEQKLRKELKSLKKSLKKYFNKDQIDFMSGKRVKWSNATIQKGIILKSKLGYKFYTRTFTKKYAPYPSSTTIHGRLKNYKIQPGILKFNIKVLGTKLNKLPKEHRSIGLLFDDKALIPSTQSDGPSNNYQGFTTLLPSEAIRKKEGENVRAKNSLVVLAVGMNIREKELVGLHYTAGCTDGNALKDFLLAIITYIETTQDIFVDWVGFDVGPSNQSFLKACGISLCGSNIEYFIQHPVRPNDKLFFKPDDVHNQKNIISGLRKNDFKFAPCLVELFNLNSSVISFKEVEKIYKQQQHCDMKAAKKLKQECIKPSNFETMREYVAYEVFSSDVWTAITFNDKKADINGKKNATASFLQVMSIFHSIVSNNKGWSRNDKEKYEEDIEFLSWFVDDFLSNIKTTSSLRCVPAMNMSIRSLIALSKMYFERGYEKVIPAWFLSNAIENIFSMVTSIFKKPSAVLMAQALRIISLQQFEFDSTTASYGWDETNPNSIDFLALLQEFVKDEKLNSNIDEEEVELLKISIDDEVSSSELYNTEITRNVFYIEMCKILIKVLNSISCKDCKKILIDDEMRETADNRLLREQKMGNFQYAELFYLSRNVERYFCRLEFIFQKLSLQLPAHHPTFASTFIMNANEVLVPEEHCITTTAKIISMFIAERLKLSLHRYMPHKALKSASKSLV